MDSYEQALRKAIEDYETSIRAVELAQQQLQAAQLSAAEFLSIARQLVKLVPDDCKDRYTQRIEGLENQSDSSGRPKTELKTVERLLRQDVQREWTAIDIGTELRERGSNVEMKSISNTLQYMYKRGDLKRIGRGKYVVVGLGIGVESDAGYGDPEAEEA